MPRPLSTLALAGLVLAGSLVGCATPVGVERVDAREAHVEQTRSILNSGRPTARSLQLLDRLALVEAYEEDPAASLETIRRGLGGPDTAIRLLALAELSFAHARQSGMSAWYRASVLFAYAYLFPDDGREDPNPFDPGLRLAAELYNQSLAIAFRDRRGTSPGDIAGTWPLPFGELRMTVDPTHLGWSGYKLSEFVASAELRVRGLRNRYRRVGIGAPLAAAVERVGPQEKGHFVGGRSRVPVTAFVRFPKVSEAAMTGQADGQLELYLFDQAKSLRIGGRVVPLEYEPTTALAFTLDNPRIWEFELGGFFGEDRSPFGDTDGLVLLHPYRPGRIPVVLVHGTASSPGRWAELVNEIQGDPAIGDRVQLWLFFYETGNPILFSGGLLRRSLLKTVEDLDPEGLDPALQQMIVIGHSQGGLLTRLQVVGSGNAFWSGISSTPFADFEMASEARDFLEPLAFFEPLPFVKRAVYISTPHGGSYQARRRIAGWISSLITLPVDLSRRALTVLRDNPEAKLTRRVDRLPTSLDNMTPGHPFLEALSSREQAPWVTSHSIIAVQGVGPVELGSDGVVTYESAHIEGVASEKVVRWGHSVQGHPHAIAEVKRILFLHLEALEAAQVGDTR